MTQVYIGLGGNSPGTPGAFRRSRIFLESVLEGARFSSLYRTMPQLDLDQEDFWNAVAGGDWAGTSAGLLERLLMFEAGEGRVRDPRRPKGPRVLDLDLLVFGREVSRTPRLTVPHPALASRRFVLEPLLELAPHIQDPVSGSFWALGLETVAGQGVDRTDLPW